jgi:hypothetical protein
VLRCPVCKAENAQGSQCRRCKADLSLLFQLEEQRAALLAAAVEAVRTRRYEEALVSARRAHQLRYGDDSRRMLAMLHLVQYDFYSAWLYHSGQPARLGM